MDSSKNLSILIAEDSQQDFELVQISLRESGYQGELIWFKNGEEILDFLKSKEFKSQIHLKNYLIILDINMPKTNGFETLSFIKQDPSLKLLPCIILTTSCSDKDVKTAYRLGANSYMTKPFDLDSMHDVFKSIQSYWLEKSLLPSLA